MRKIERVGKFKRDYRRESKGKAYAEFDPILSAILLDLARDIPLDQKFRDHPLGGNFRGYRECHIKPDLLLIYQKPDDNRLILHRLGSHSELGFG